MKALISLFRPINVPLPTYVAPSASNMAIVQPTYGLQVLYPRPAQAVSSSRYDHYEATAPVPSIYDHYAAAPSVARVQQPSIEEPRVVQQTTFPHHADPYYPYRR